MRLFFSLSALFGNLSCKLIILLLSIPPYIYVVTIVVYNILYQDILYNFNVHRAEQTEAWTHLERSLEQLSLNQDLKIFSTFL